MTSMKNKAEKVTSSSAARTTHFGRPAMLKNLAVLAVAAMLLAAPVGTALAQYSGPAATALFDGIGTSWLWNVAPGGSSNYNLSGLVNGASISTTTYFGSTPGAATRPYRISENWRIGVRGDGGAGADDAGVAGARRVGGVGVRRDPPASAVGPLCGVM